MILQVLLITAMIGVTGLVLRSVGGHRQLALRRLVGVALAAGGVVAVLWPSGVTWVAQLVGVGRGTDLVLYVAVMFFLFTTASLYQRVELLQTQLTVVVREIAVASPHRPADLVEPVAPGAEGRGGA